MVGVRLSEAEARERMAAAPVARLGTADARGRPHIVAVTFAVDGDRVYTAVDAKPKTTPNLKRLRNIAENPLVTVFADHYEDDWRELWWVRADGNASVLDGAQRVKGPIGMLVSRYAQYRDTPPEGPVIAVRVERWTGWSAA